MEDSFDALCPVGWFGAVAEGDDAAGAGGLWAGGAGASATLFEEVVGCDVS